MTNEINLSNCKLGDEFMTRSGMRVTFVYEYNEGDTTRYVVTIGNPVYMSYPVYENGKANLDMELGEDLVEQVAGGTLQTSHPYYFTDDIDKQNETYSSLMTKLMDQVGDIGKEKRLDRREHIAIALIRAAHGKYSNIQQDIDFIEEAINKLKE